MAHTKSGGSTKLGRDSVSKRLGIKKNHGQAVKTGEIIVRQRGTRYFAGRNVRRAGDDSLFAIAPGIVQFASKRKTKFDGSKKDIKVVTIVPAQ